ncbi:hypothetical protein [Cellulomonas cellasea]|uniref:RiboL-PSP-HEPN domain-containing protein n=1 Tax=Cellulomonas cellasea TaxID=43670 RepID=A0A7W4UGG9_9CELL|nr:hypothetical protein [Cellulomonas cellasea]MBB2923760.1 hypothetical protein [Cellulomonas cellasea]
MAVKPLDFALDLLDRAEELAKLAGNPPQGTSDVKMDVLRSAWVFIGASIDTYFHERIRRTMLQDMSKSARKFEVPLGDVDDMVALFLANRKEARPRVKLGNIIHQALLKQTFQGATNVERAFGLIGQTKYWKEISVQLGEPVEDIKSRLNTQYQRRNRISHEGDYTRQSRPQQFWYYLLDRTAVDEEIAWTRRFLKAADSL